MDTTYPLWVNDGSPLPPLGEYTLDTGSNTFKARVGGVEDGTKRLLVKLFDFSDEYADRTQYVGSVSASSWTLSPLGANNGEAPAEAGGEEDPEEAVNEQPLIPGGVYTLTADAGGTNYAIAVSTTHVVCGSSVAFIPSGPYRLMYAPGEKVWEEYMTGRLRTFGAESASLAAQTKYLDDLREAILEKAQEMDWCSEYEEFAAQWDLLPRIWEYEVEVVYRVEARSSEEAEEYFEGFEGPGNAGYPEPNSIRAVRA